MLAGGTKINLNDTRILSPRAVSRLSVTIGHCWYLFKHLAAKTTTSLTQLLFDEDNRI